MITITTVSQHSPEVKNYFVSKQLENSGFKNKISGFNIKIISEISDSDLEEIRWVYPKYKITK